jgi:hypothetical protein
MKKEMKTIPMMSPATFFSAEISTIISLNKKGELMVHREAPSINCIRSE